LNEKNSVKIRGIADSDKERVFSLHNETYHDSRSPEDWLWEYKTCYPESSVFVIGEVEGHIVGTQGMIPILLNIRGQERLTAKSENSLLKRSYRGGTLFQEMYDLAMTMCRERGICCVWGFTTATKVWRDKLRFSVYENAVQTYVLTLKPGELPASVQNKMRNKFASVLVLLSYLYSSVRCCAYDLLNAREEQGVAVENEPRSRNDLDQLYVRLRLKYRGLIHIEQNSNYLNWRIANNPNNQYTEYFVYEREMLRAYCYLNVKDGVARITDFTSEDGTKSRILLQRVIRDLKTQQVGFVLYMGNTFNELTSATLRIFKRIGFLRVNMLQTSLILKNVCCDENLSDVKDWYVNGLWTEGYEW
jgi:hypothetical protein